MSRHLIIFIINWASIFKLSFLSRLMWRTKKVTAIVVKLAGANKGKFQKQFDLTVIYYTPICTMRSASSYLSLVILNQLIAKRWSISSGMTGGLMTCQRLQKICVYGVDVTFTHDCHRKSKTNATFRGSLLRRWLDPVCRKVPSLVLSYFYCTSIMVYAAFYVCGEFHTAVVYVDYIGLGVTLC